VTNALDPLIDFEDKVPTTAADNPTVDDLDGEVIPFGLRFAREAPRMDKHSRTYKTVTVNETTTINNDGTTSTVTDSVQREVED